MHTPLASLYSTSTASMIKEKNAIYVPSNERSIAKLTLLVIYNADHSGDLGVATKEPRKGRPAASGRELLRLVKWPWAHGPLELLLDSVAGVGLERLETGRYSVAVYL